MKLKWKILLAVIVVLLVIFLLALTGVIQAGSLKEMWDKNPFLTIILAPILFMVWLGNKLAGKNKADMVTLPSGDTMTRKEYLKIKYDWLVENYPEYYTEEGASDCNVSIHIDEDTGTVTYVDNSDGHVITVENPRHSGASQHYNVR